jgi:hypothetical protein
MYFEENPPALKYSTCIWNIHSKRAQKRLGRRNLGDEPTVRETELASISLKGSRPASYGAHFEAIGYEH